jgi:hypothetical protein
MTPLTSRTDLDELQRKAERRDDDQGTYLLARCTPTPGSACTTSTAR